MDIKDSVLKKEFNRKDINRLRNIISGKTDEFTHTQIGYSKNQHIYNEGDIWEEDNRKWTIKNGIKQNITKFDKAKEFLLLPLFCPKCNNIMNHRYDKQFYNIHNHCFNCQIELENKLKLEGNWEEYEKNIINNQLENLSHEFETWINNEMEESNESFITEQGDVEKWVGSNKEKLLKIKKETLEYLKTLKKE